MALRSLARRHHTSMPRPPSPTPTRLTLQVAPRLLSEPGVGPEIAARLLIVAGDDPHRLRSDAALDALCGGSPVEASSGQTIRYRLNRGGDRQGNDALWTVANNRMIHHAETRDYGALAFSSTAGDGLAPLTSDVERLDARAIASVSTSADIRSLGMAGSARPRLPCGDSQPRRDHARI